MNLEYKVNMVCNMKRDEWERLGVEEKVDVLKKMKIYHKYWGKCLDMD